MLYSKTGSLKTQLNPDRRILVFIDWYLPGYKAGGPIQSTANMIAHLRNDFNFGVVTGDADLNETIPYKGIKIDNWNRHPNGTMVYYIGRASKNYRTIRSILAREKFDILYLNSFFSVYFTLLPLIAIKLNGIRCRVIVAPRGMMGKGSLGIKPFKKKLFISLAKATGLFRDVFWHASTPGEMDEIRNVFGHGVQIRNAINLTSPRFIVREKKIKETGTAQFFSLARISPVKNILAIFRYLAKVDPDLKISVHLYGTMEDSVYISKCIEVAKTFPSNVSAEFLGPIENSLVQEMCRKYQFMILPTQNENFGHAIVESFIAGCPVLISNRTPWKDLEKQKAGWDLPLENDSLFIEKINLCGRMDQNEYDQWCEGAYSLGEKIVKNDEGIEQNKQLFLS